MDFYVIVNKRLQELAVGDVIFEDIGRLTRGVHVVNTELKQSLQKYKAYSVHTLQNLSEEPVKQDKIREFLDKREETLDMGFSHIRNDIFALTQELYIPFSEEQECFNASRKKKHISKHTLFNPYPNELASEDILAGSQAILPASKVKALNESLLTAYRFFNGFKRKSIYTKGEKRTFARQNYFSSRLPTIYHPARDKIEVLGDEIVWHAVDTALYFLATLVNLNKIRHAQGKPLSNLRFLLETDLQEEGEYTYHPHFIISATLGALLAPIAYMHHSLLTVLYKQDKQFNSQELNLLKKAPLVAFNLVRYREDIPAIAKLIVRKQSSYHNKQGESYLKDSESSHEFIRLYHIIKSYDFLVHPFLLPAPVSRQETIAWLIHESCTYDPHVEKDSLKTFDSKMLGEFLNIIAPYKNGELVYLVHQNKKDVALYRGFVLNYNNDSTSPLISVLYDYQNDKHYPPGRIIFDLPHSKIFFLKENKVVKQIKNNRLSELEIHDLNLKPTKLESVKYLL